MFIQSGPFSSSLFYRRDFSLTARSGRFVARQHQSAEKGFFNYFIINE